MARVALVNLASLPMPGNEPIFPIGLRCVQDALDRAGHETLMIDFVESPHAVDDLSWLDAPWDVVGFTIRNIDPIDLACGTHVDHYARFIDRVRDALGERRPLLVGGGPGYTLFADALLARLELDVGVIGPGEQVMLDIVADPAGHRGSGRNLVGTRYPDFLTDALVHPRSLMAAHSRTEHAMIGVETRRKTCYQGCVYCPYAYITGDNDGDVKPPAVIATELRAIHAAGVRRVFFTDSIFNSELRYAKDVVRMLIEEDLPGLSWGAYFTPKPFDDEFAYLLSQSNVEYVLISPDSLDDQMMRVLGKSFETRHVDRCIERCKRHGLEVRVSVVFGGPGENRETIRNSANYANSKLGDEELVLHLGYRVLPGTAMAKQVGLPDSQLLSPTFFPIDPDLFSWVLEDLDSRFMTPLALLNLMAGRMAASKMAKVALDEQGSGGGSTGFPYLALTRVDHGS